MRAQNPRTLADLEVIVPAFIVVDDKGNDFFTDPSGEVTVPLGVLRVRSKE